MVKIKQPRLSQMKRQQLASVLRDAFPAADGKPESLSKPSALPCKCSLLCRRITELSRLEQTSKVIGPNC